MNFRICTPFAAIVVLWAFMSPARGASESVTNGTALPTTNAPREKVEKLEPGAVAAPPGKRAAEGSARPGGVTNALSFDSFKMVAEKNIFNANRSRTSRATGAAARKAPLVESFALAGTMSYEKGPVAFFVSATSQFRKAAKAGEAIAGYAVKEILPGSVKLEHAGGSIDLKVGEQMKREDEGAWQVSARAEIPASSTSAVSTNASSGAESEVLRRLLQKREKELNP